MKLLEKDLGMACGIHSGCSSSVNEVTTGTVEVRDTDDEELAREV